MPRQFVDKYPSSRWPWPGETGKYSVEDTRKIVAGLVSGRRPGHRPMSDAEFRARYAPESDNTKLINKIDKLVEVMTDGANANPVEVVRERPNDRGTRRGIST